MTKATIALFTSLLLISACASISEKGRMEKLKDLTTAYDHALLRADYQTAADYIDPAIRRDDIDFNQYKRIKIVDCRTTRAEFSEDKMNVTRDVELQYFLVDRNILRSTRYRQQWQYDKEKDVWRLQSELPAFER